MPQSEAPLTFGDSSPDGSLSPPPQATARRTAAAAVEAEAETGQHAVIHIRIHTPDQQSDASFDRDLPTHEEDNHYPPAAVHLLPITFPPAQPAEPTLDELLRRVSERNDLHNVESIRLRVISYTVSLSRLSLFLPRLQHLDLSGSVLGSLRDLGFGLVQLSCINVSNCGLNSFDGTSGLPNIREMVADGNMIQRVGPLADLPLLQSLSVQNNRISDLGLLSFLGMCPNLTEVRLQGNPVCHLSLYQTTLVRSVPTLLMLDGRPLESAFSNVTATSTDDGDSELSSLSSEHALRTDRRPATAPIQVRSPRPMNTNRPASAVDQQNATMRSTLTQGALVVGSVLSLARRSRRRRNFIAWNSNNNSSSNSTSISESEAVFTRPMDISNCSSPEPSSSTN